MVRLRKDEPLSLHEFAGSAHTPGLRPPSSRLPACVAQNGNGVYLWTLEPSVDVDVTIPARGCDLPSIF